MNASRVDSLLWNNKTIYIKRDDLLDSYFSGNKYRKLYYYLCQKNLNYSQILSYGGIQSNAMLSMAALAHEKSLPFIYFTRYLPKGLSLDLESNYSKALALGMEIKIHPANSDEALRDYLLSYYDKQTLFIPQGAASSQAQYGIEVLAQEIMQWKKEQSIDNLTVATPSGTGTTALWLQNYLVKENITVLTTAAVGDESYLKQQMQRLNPRALLPLILKTEKKYTFAKPNVVLYKQYQSFLEKGIKFDLIYAPVMWQALQENQNLWANSTLLYIHSGGVMGNESQLLRYEKILKANH